MRISDWSSDVCSSDLTAHRSTRLFRGATRGFTVALVASRERERRQPGFAADGPQLVGRHQLVGCIQGPEVHFDLVTAASEDGRSAAGAEAQPGVVARFAPDTHPPAREYPGVGAQGPLRLASGNGGSQDSRRMVHNS